MNLVQLGKLGVRVFEIVPPPVDTELNQRGRAQCSGFKVAPGPEEFVAAVMRGLENDVPEIGYGMTANFGKASSRTELDQIFTRINAGF